MRYHVVAYISAVMFSAALFGHLLPWMVIGTEAISGFDIARGKYGIAPTEWYAALAIAAALCGIVIPLVIRRRRTWSRVWCSVAGLLIMAFFFLHRPEAVSAVSPATGLGALLTAAAFVINLFLNWAVIGRLFTPETTRRKPVWK